MACMLQAKIEFPLLSQKEQETLFDALHYMKMAELKNACLSLALPEKGKKTELINRIMTFIETGRIITSPTLPASSRAKNYPIQPLAPASLMLYGEYKNDLKTRAFFQSLIGAQFHFTAYGIDWLNDRWLEGKPPTYQEFADYWTTETKQRKQVKAAPKDEWMFIRFMQSMEKTEPNASQKDLLEAWKLLQAQKALEAQKLLQIAIKKPTTAMKN